MNKFFKQYRYQLLFILILLIAGIIRGYQLGVVPHGMTWDEAAIGYNGYAIWKVHRDEWLVKMPISFRSFGDYKAPFAIYLNGLFTLIFGMNLWAVRLPFFLFSIIAVSGLILLVRELFSSRKNFPSADFLSLLAGGAMTLSPWHIHYSRVGFESGMALGFVIWGVYLLLKFVKEKKKKLQYFFFLTSVLSFVLSVYTYHSAKVVVPLLGLILLVLNFKKIKEKINPFISGSIFGLFLLFPFIKDSLFGSGAERLGQASFIKEEMSLVEVISQFLNHYLSHFSLNFLIMGQTTTLRHGDGVWGVLLVTTLILVLLSLLIAIIKKKTDKVFWLGLLWILIGTLPAAIGEDVPHSNRALLALPGFLILASWGLQYSLQLIKQTKVNKKILGSHGEKNLVVKAVIGTFILIHIFLAVSYLNHYFTSFSSQSAAEFKDGYLEAFSIAREYEKGLNGKPQVEQIVFTDDYGQAYIYALFVRQTNPIWYQGGSLVKYLFTDVKAGDFVRKNTLLVTSASDGFDLTKADQIVMGSDEQPKFIFYYIPGKENASN